jgi:hypothetical protein
MWIYTSTPPTSLRGVMLNYLSTGTTLPLPYTIIPPQFLNVNENFYPTLKIGCGLRIGC